MMISRCGASALALGWVALSVSASVLASDGSSNAERACTALSGLRIPAGAIGLPTTGATVEKAHFVTSALVAARYCSRLRAASA